MYCVLKGCFGYVCCVLKGCFGNMLCDERLFAMIYVVCWKTVWGKMYYLLWQCMLRRCFGNMLCVERLLRICVEGMYGLSRMCRRDVWCTCISTKTRSPYIPTSFTISQRPHHHTSIHPLTITWRPPITIHPYTISQRPDHLTSLFSRRVNQHVLFVYENGRAVSLIFLISLFAHDSLEKIIISSHIPLSLRGPLFL